MRENIEERIRRLERARDELVVLEEEEAVEEIEDEIEARRILLRPDGPARSTYAAAVDALLAVDEEAMPEGEG